MRQAVNAVKQRLNELFLGISTEYAELLLGIASIDIGLWLILRSDIGGYASWQIAHLDALHWGVLLLSAGVLKFIGVWRRSLCIRIVSCFVGLLAWTFLFLTFHSISIMSTYTLAVPITAIFATFNAAIFIKLGALAICSKQR